MEVLLTIAVVSLLGAISPGPDFAIVVKNNLSYSRKAGFLTSLGISLALLVHLTYTLLGIGILMQEGTLVNLLIKYTSAAYLFYLGCKGFVGSFAKKRATETGVFSTNDSSISSWAALRQGFLTNLLNPKCALYFVSLFSQFIEINSSLSIKIAIAFINWSLTLLWFLFLSYIITSNLILSRLHTFQNYIHRIMGCALMLIAIKIMF